MICKYAYLKPRSTWRARSVRKLKIFFAQATQASQISAQPQLKGQAVALEQALDKAAELLREAQRPVCFADAEVVATQNVLALAERCGAVFDHPASGVMQRNIGMMQTEGWVSTSLTEARNRADLVVIFGIDVLALYPRLVERVLKPAQMLFASHGQREFVVIGGTPDHFKPLADAEFINASVDELGLLAGQLRAGLRNTPLQAVDETRANALAQLAQRLRQARYPVIVWAAQELNLAHADLLVQQFIALVQELSEHTRCVALPLAAGGGDVTAQQVSTWRCGFPPPVSFQQGFPDYDPVIHDVQPFKASVADLVFCLAGFSAAAPALPAAAARIVLGHPAMSFDVPPDVFIPVAIPAVDQDGQLFRGDGVVVPLPVLRSSAHPAAASVVQQISTRLHQSSMGDD